MKSSSTYWKRQRARFNTSGWSCRRWPKSAQVGLLDLQSKYKSILAASLVFTQTFYMLWNDKFVDIIFTHWIFLWQHEAFSKKKTLLLVKIKYNYFEIKNNWTTWLHGAVVGHTSFIPKNRKTLFIRVTISNVVIDEISELILQCDQSLQCNVKL